MTTVFQQVREEIARQPPGAILALEDFVLPIENTAALAKSLSRLSQNGTLRRLVKGLYYKPAIGILGEISTPPDKSLLLKLLALYKDKISYMTGTNVYNKMGLTTQVANEYVIASDKPRSPVQVGPTRVRFIRSHVKVPITDTVVIQLLDAIWEIKNIPANTPAKAAQVLLGQLRKLTPTQRQALATHAQAYPPLTRALTGLFLETLGEKTLSAQLKKSLNPLSTFKIALDTSVFPASRTWNIL